MCSAFLEIRTRLCSPISGTPTTWRSRTGQAMRPHIQISRKRVAMIRLTSTHTVGATYSLTLSNVKDLIGNNLTPNTTTMYANVFQAGILSYKRWMGGGNLQGLINNPLRFADPDAEFTL